MPNAVIVDVVRTPVGKKNGRLSGWHAVDLAAQPLRSLIERNDLDPALVEDVIYGCTMTVGEQAMNIGRNAALAAGFPDTVPGTTVDRQCGSAQQAVHFAAQAVMATRIPRIPSGNVTRWDLGAPSRRVMIHLRRPPTRASPEPHARPRATSRGQRGISGFAEARPSGVWGSPSREACASRQR